MADIFISYAKEDEDRIRPLVKTLEAQGWSVFWDHRIPAGQTWRTYIGKALHDARSVIVAWSKFSLDSDWVSEEADVGKSRKVLVPILLDEVLPPMGFRSIQAADLSDWDGEKKSPELEQLMSDLRLMLSKSKALPLQKKPEQPLEKTKKTPETASKKRWVLYAGIVIILIVIGGIYFTRNEPVVKKQSVDAAKEVREAIEDVEESPTNTSTLGVRYYIGRWTNTDSNTRGITKLNIRYSNGIPYVHAWGSCSPTDCDWGEIKAEAFASSVSANSTTDAQILRAEYKKSFAVTVLVIKPERGGRIKVESSTRFTDQSGRSSYAADYYFQK